MRYGWWNRSVNNTCNVSAFFSPSPSRAAASSNLPCCLKRRSWSLSLARRACLSCSESRAHSAAPICFSRASRSSLSLSASYLSSRAFRSSSSWETFSSVPRSTAEIPSNSSSCQEVCSCCRRRNSSWMSWETVKKPKWWISYCQLKRSCFQYWVS